MYEWMERIRDKGLFQIILIDLLMLLLLWVNLNLIIFDAVFSVDFIQNLLKEYLPNFHRTYDEYIHQHFQLIDFFFVGVFIIELLYSWVVAIFKGSYHRWFFYPFVHWYDVLGCIPVGSLRFLRGLRVISILVKMQKLQIIDLTKTYLFSVFMKYLDVLTEEVSDRVVINVLDGISDEIRAGSPVYEQVLYQVVLPKKTFLNQWLSNRIQLATQEIQKRHKDNFRLYVRSLTKQALSINKGMKELKILPFFGSYMEGLLEEMISEITYEIMINMTFDFGSEKSTELVADLSHIILEMPKGQSSQFLNDTVKEMLLEVLTIVKDQTQVQQWKLRDLEERATRRRARMKKRAQKDLTA